MVGVKRFRNYVGLIEVSRSGFPWEKTTKGDVAPPDFLRAALIEGNDVRLSSRKAACSSMAPPSSTGNPGSAHINCETTIERFSQGASDATASSMASIGCLLLSRLPSSNSRRMAEIKPARPSVNNSPRTPKCLKPWPSAHVI
jgi:hypothetical protein